MVFYNFVWAVYGKSTFVPLIADSSCSFVSFFQLCSLLKSPSHSSQPLEVEPAYEAGETRTDKQSVVVQRAVSPPTQLALCQNQEKQKVAAAKRKDVQVPPPKSDVDMKLLSITEGLCECVHGAPSKDPLGTGYSTEEKPPFT
jgi:hypothetical protein